jgi:hypothetical protein
MKRKQLLLYSTLYTRFTSNFHLRFYLVLESLVAQDEVGFKVDLVHKPTNILSQSIPVVHYIQEGENVVTWFSFVSSPII